MNRSICLPLFLGILLSHLFLSVSCTRTKTVTLESLVTEMGDRHSVTYMPDPWYSLKQFSSYDRHSLGPGEDGWFANSDYTMFIREESNMGRREFVMFDDSGPGAIVRWWMTFAGAGSSDGTIRVYIDDHPTPVIEANVLEVLSGHQLVGEPFSSSVSPESDYLQRGHNLYLPIPYALGCKVTYECDSIRELDGRMIPSIYYNINYRKYEENTKVISFSSGQLDSARVIIEKTGKILTEPLIGGIPETVPFKLAPGEDCNYKLTQKNSAIRSVCLRLSAGDMAQALRSTVITATFDDVQTIWIPAGDFFGTGTIISPYSTFNSEVEDNGMMIFERIMPFRKYFELKVFNYGEQEIEGELGVSAEEYKWKSSSMYFGASWHEYNAIKAAGSEFVGGSGGHYDINFIDINGTGVYAGDAVSVFNTEDAWWGEGDEKIYVDDELFPSSIGTGTEDYYGYAWCRPEIFSHPFIAQPRGDGNFHPGLSINLRHRGLDAIPFRDNISSNIELWHWAPAVINYALTTWFYIMPGFSTNHNPDPDLVTIPVAKERKDLVSNEVDEWGNLEGENLEVMAVTGGQTETQFITSWDWSNKGQLWWYGGEPGDSLLARFRVPETGNYTLILRLTMASDYGITSYFINNMPVTRFNGYTNGEKVTEIIAGDFILPEGDNILSLVIQGKQKEARVGYMAGIDRITLKPVNQ